MPGVTECIFRKNLLAGRLRYLIWPLLADSCQVGCSRPVITMRAADIGRAGMPVELAGIYVQLADSQGSLATGQVYGAAGSADGMPHASRD